MVDGLAAVATIVDDHPEALVQPLCSFTMNHNVGA